MKELEINKKFMGLPLNESKSHVMWDVKSNDVKKLKNFKNEIFISTNEILNEIKKLKKIFNNNIDEILLGEPNLFIGHLKNMEMWVTKIHKKLKLMFNNNEELSNEDWLNYTYILKNEEYLRYYFRRFRLDLDMLAHHIGMCPEISIPDNQLDVIEIEKRYEKNRQKNSKNKRTIIRDGEILLFIYNV